jgi:hypothetical protein
MTTFGDVPVGSALVVCPSRKSQAPANWIEIEFVGEDDRPIPWEEYLVMLPDGTAAKGYLDGDGFARLEGITQGGVCIISFPALDEQAWTYVQTLPMKAGQR